MQSPSEQLERVLFVAFECRGSIGLHANDLYTARRELNDLRQQRDTFAALVSAFMPEHLPVQAAEQASTG